MERLNKYFGGYCIPEKVLVANLDPEIINRSYDNSSGEIPITAKPICYFMVLEGWLEITVDKKIIKCEKKQNNLLHISPFNAIYRCRASNDISGFLFSISKEFMDEYLRGKRPFNPNDMQSFQINPAITIDTVSINELSAICRTIKIKFINGCGKFKEEIIALKSMEFIYEFASIMTDDSNWPPIDSSSRTDTIMKELFSLLINDCRRYHEVSYYAEKLCITPQYLNKLTKTKLSRSASNIIADFLITEAVLLLQDPDLSIQQVSEKLYFSDQSAFGKFFKKHAGQSPLMYKKSL